MHEDKSILKKHFWELIFELRTVKINQPKQVEAITFLLNAV